MQGAHQAIVAVMSSADQSSNSFASDSLVVTAPGSAAQSLSRARAARVAVSPKHITPVEAFPADDGRLLQRLQRFAAPPSAHANTLGRNRQGILPQTLRAGVQADIWVQQGPMSGPRPSVQVPATLLYQTPHGNIWVDNTIAGALRNSVSQIGEDFENAYVSDTARFASPDYPSSAPGLQPQYASCAGGGSRQGTTSAYIQEPADRRIDVMVVNGPALGGLGGYFSVANLMPQSALNCLNGNYESNEAPFIFVGYFSGDQTYELQEDLVRSTAHELQHLINFVNHGILAAGASSSSFNGYESTFVNEGLSMLAQDFAVQTMYGGQGVQFDAADALQRANAYLADPGNYSLSGFTGIDPSNWGGGGVPVYNCNGGCYGAAYLFQRYLRDRFGGDAYTRTMETSGVVGPANLQATTGESASQLQDDFALAMAADTMGITTADHRFKFGALSLTQSYRDQFGGTTNLGGVFAAQISGSSATVHAALGGFAYVAIGSVPSSGMSVQVTDQASVSGFGLAGGLAQH